MLESVLVGIFFGGQLFLDGVSAGLGKCAGACAMLRQESCLKITASSNPLHDAQLSERWPAIKEVSAFKT